jgi:uncharacterized cupin superfamily protein
LHYNLGEEEYLLSAGDTLFYHDDLAHHWVNIGEEIAVILTVSVTSGYDDR